MTAPVRSEQPEVVRPGILSKQGQMIAMLISGAVLGKLTGFARELSMALVFGATTTADSFRAAMTAVQLPLVPFLSETMSAVLIPLQHSWRRRNRAPVMLMALCVALGLSSVVLMLLVELAGHWWVKLLVGRFHHEGLVLVLDFTRIMALSMPAVVLYECLASAEIADGKSRLLAVRSAVLNLFIIAGVFLYATTGALDFLPWLFTLSWYCLCLWAVLSIWNSGVLNPKGARPQIVAAAAREFFTRLRPLISLPIFQQANTWIERFVASGLVIGTLSSLEYARTLTDTASLLIGQPIAMAVLYNGSTEHTHESVLATARPVLAIAVPLSIFLAVFSHDVVEVVFARGAFDEHAVALTSGGVFGIALGLWAGTLGTTLLRHLNNAGRNGHVALIMAGSFAIGIALNLLTLRYGNVGTNSAMLLGLAEATRSVTLLIAVAVALNCYWPLMRLVGSCVLPAAAMCVVFGVIQQYYDTAPARVIVGGGACAVAVLLLIHFLMPSQFTILRRHLSRSQ